jgi:hypothetical protein
MLQRADRSMAIRRHLAKLIVLAFAGSAGPLCAGQIELALPIACEVGQTCLIQNYVDHDPSGNARDYACGGQTYDGHNGIDIRLPSMAQQRAGVAVRAAADGVVRRTRCPTFRYARSGSIRSRVASAAMA